MKTYAPNRAGKRRDRRRRPPATRAACSRTRSSCSHRGFGRTRLRNRLRMSSTGRDHNQYGFSVWLPAGLKHGIARRGTDDVGWKSGRESFIGTIFMPPCCLLGITCGG